MSRVGLRSYWALQLALAVALTAMAVFAVPAAVAAEGERVLDLQLSLIGGCKQESLDPVEDPGCPNNPPAGPHPAGTFSDPRGVATDDYGNIYVSSRGSSLSGSKGHVDIFCSDGTFISSLPVPGATSLAIDSKGQLYVFAIPSSGADQLLRYGPDPEYQPESCEIGYGTTPPSLVQETLSDYSGLAVNRDDDHLFANFGSAGVSEYKSAEEGNELVRTTQAAVWSGGNGMAVDSARDRMYASAGLTEERIDIFDLNSVTPGDEYEVIGSIVESSVPAKSFGTQLSIAVDEGNGHVFVLDGENCNLYEFEEDGTYLATIPISFVQCTFGPQIGVDNGPFSPNGALSEKGRYLYVPSHGKGIGHSFAFFESTEGAPAIESTAAANISADEAELRAQIDPNNLPTAYTFEYKIAGAEDWIFVGEGTLPAGNAPTGASAPATGLAPETSYLFRVTATNEAGSDEAEGSFATYPSVATDVGGCPNALLRTGLSALLPDCRAYELVTPADTNARAPLGAGGEGGTFATRQVSPAGDKVPFRVEGGALPGLGGTGSLVGDPYLASRTPTGWSTAYTGPSGAEATAIAPGTTSPDQGYLFWWAGVSGSAVLAPTTAYVRYPDGHSELVGQGSLGIDPEASGQLISEGGGQIIFSTGVIKGAAVQLEPEAAPDGTWAVYDRTADGITHVVSLKPGGSSFVAGENARFLGASIDAEGIAFSAGGTLYLRYRNSETFAIGNGVEFAGVAEGGGRIFYVEDGDLKAFDVSEGVIDFAATGDAIPATVSADGSTAYFISETAIAESGPNPAGDEPATGEQNLYRSVEGQIGFLGTVTDRDVEGQPITAGDGLGLWVMASEFGRLGLVPARSTPDGKVFLFKSRAALTKYDPEGHAQVYRFDAAENELKCLSCNPTGAPAISDATLQSESREGGAELYSIWGWPENLRADGRRALFESSEALVAGDGDNRKDVYEWEDQGVGTCQRPGGCIYLVSSPQSSSNEYLWAVSASGDDVFFISSDLLVGADADGTPSIYDARVGGGFSEETAGECEGEGCRPSQQAQPPQPTVLTPVLGPGDNFKPVRCPKGKHKVKRGGKVRCVKKKHHKNRAKHRAGAETKGGRR